MHLDWTRLLREKKLWYRVNRAAVNRNFYSVLAQIPLYLYLFFFDNFFQKAPQASVLLLVAGLMLLACRALGYYQFTEWHGRKPLRWRVQFSILNYCAMAHWAAFLMVLQLVYRHPSAYQFIIGLAVLHWILLADAWIPYKHGWFTLTSASVLPFLVSVNSPVSIALIIAVWLVTYYQGRILQSVSWHYRLLRRDYAKTARDLAQTQETQTSNDHLGNEFLASLSREIRTPMTNVLGMLRLLSETELSTDQRRMQNIATSAGENIILLVDELLDLSKIMSGQLVLDSVVFNIRQCIDATINLLSPMAYGKNTELTHICDADIPLRVRGDARRLSQVLSNVISFIIDCTEGGEIAVNVHLTPSHAVEGVLRIHVSSKNTLVPEAVQQQIQELLDQKEHLSHVSPNHLGIVIAKGVIDTMRGGMGFVVAGQHGMTFWITAQITLSTQQTFQSKTPEQFFHKRVLLIDMTPGLIASLRNDLDSWSMEVDQTQGYQKALEIMREAARDGDGYHLAILNMALEYVGSLKLSTIMSEDPSLAQVKQIILCTVEQRGMSTTIQHEKHLEHCLFLTKPFSRGNLYHAILRSLTNEYEPHMEAHKSDALEVVENGHKYQILLVEDNRVNQMVAIGLLKKFGYTAEVAERGGEALERMKAKRFDLVLMDCNLPDIDGYTVSRDYRNFEASREIDPKSEPLNPLNSNERTAIIALTANATEGEEARCFAAGMDDYLTKPIQADKMAIRLRTWLEQAPVQSGVIYFQDASRNATNWSTSQRVNTPVPPTSDH